MRESSTRQVVVGLAVALGVAILLLGWVLEVSRQTIVRSGTEQHAVVTTAAVTQVLSAAQASGGDLQETAQGLVAALEPLRQLRVIDSKGRRLVVSTNADDIAAGELPRRLRREQKAWFDQAKELAAAYRTNTDEGKARKDEILRAVTAENDLELVLPVLADGEVTGSVQAVNAPVLILTSGAAWRGIVVWLVAVVVLAIAVRWLPGRRLPLWAGVAFVVAGFWTFAAIGVDGLTDARFVVERGVAAHALSVRDVMEDQVAVAGSTLDMTAWNIDRYRQPRGTFDGVGVVDTACVDATFVRSAARYRQGAVLIGILALVFNYWIAAGWARRTARALVDHRGAYAFVLPAMIGMVLLVFLPFLYGIVLSFTNQTLYNVNQPIYELWVGLDNYVDILTDVNIVKQSEGGDRLINFRNFYWTLGFTVLWTVSNVSIGVTLGLVLALILNTKGLAMRPLYRIVLILPWAVPNYITALVWKGMFHRQFGVVNQIIQMFGGEPIAWFDAWHTSFFAVLATNAWLSFPFMMVVSLGALQAISSDLYEAARVDGAGRWQLFRFVTLPSIKPALVPAVILSVVWTFNMFNIIYLVSQGEPAGATEILITDAYKIAFEQYRYGYAAAYSVVIFIVLLSYGIWQNRTTKATEGI